MDAQPDTRCRTRLNRRDINKRPSNYTATRSPRGADREAKLSRAPQLDCPGNATKKPCACPSPRQLRSIQVPAGPEEPGPCWTLQVAPWEEKQNRRCGVPSEQVAFSIVWQCRPPAHQSHLQLTQRPGLPPSASAAKAKSSHPGRNKNCLCCSDPTCWLSYGRRLRLRTTDARRSE